MNIFHILDTSALAQNFSEVHLLRQKEHMIKFRC